MSHPAKIAKINQHYERFVVEEIQTTPSGTYAKYTHRNGYTVFTGCFRFKKGDIVEWWDYEGHCPTKMKVNGELVWTWGDWSYWWRNVAVNKYEVPIYSGAIYYRLELSGS